MKVFSIFASVHVLALLPQMFALPPASFCDHFVEWSTEKYAYSLSQESILANVKSTYRSPCIRCCTSIVN